MRKNNFVRRRVPLALAAVACLIGLAPAASAQKIKVGEEMPYVVASPHPILPLESGGPSWSTVVEHPGATYIAIHLDGFDLAPGDWMVVRSPDGAQSYEFRQGEGRAVLDEFWATHIKGDVAVLEVFSAGLATGGVSIDRYAAGFSRLMAEPESVCGTNDLKNSKCYNDGLTVPPDDIPAYNKGKAVARLLITGSFLCTGWLAGCEGHLFTNQHCIENQTEASNTDYEFGSEAPICGSVNNVLDWPGTIWGGAATLIRTNAAFDYTLIHLAGNPQITYGSFQMDDRLATTNERIYIPGHPSGKARMFGLQSTELPDPGGKCKVNSPFVYPCSGGPADIGYKCDSEGGSSGSPVVSYLGPVGDVDPANDHKVIGLHHCGPTTCSSSPSSLNLASPIFAVIADLGTDLPFCALESGAHLRYDAHTVDDSGSNNNGVPEPGETFVMPVDLRSDGDSTATGIAATLSTTTPLVTIVDNLATYPDLAAGATGGSDAPHYTIWLDPTLPCGTTIDFDLSIASNEGVFASSFDQLAGAGTLGAPFSYSATGLPAAIPDDNGATFLTSSLVVPDNKLIGDVELTVDISHTWIGDMEIDLISPAGTLVVPHLHSGSNNDDINTTYDSLTLSDFGNMNDFDAENVQGTWDMQIEDISTPDAGMLLSWSIHGFELDVACAAPATPAGSVPNGDDVPGTQLTVTHAPPNVNLSWGASCAGSDNDYEIYEGTIGDYTSHVQRKCSTAGATSFSLVPSAGSTYYLIVPHNTSREGSYGKDSIPAERPPQIGGGCLPQAIATCP